MTVIRVGLRSGVNPAVPRLDHHSQQLAGRVFTQRVNRLSKRAKLPPLQQRGPFSPTGISRPVGPFSQAFESVIEDITNSAIDATRR